MSSPTWNPSTPGNFNFGETGQTGPSMVLTPPERSGVDRFPTDQPPLSTSGFFLNPSAVSRGMNFGDDLSMATHQDFQHTSWDGLGDEMLNFPEMIPMFNLFSEPSVSPTSYIPL